MPKEIFQIAIDGPSGAGKSTVAKAVAVRLGIDYIDTGAMYRAIGLGVVRRGVEASDVDGVEGVLDELSVTIKHTEQGQQIYLNGENVSNLIRTPEISVAASKVAVIPSVRLKLVELQRAVAKETDVIMDGRDIGTYVLPDAQLKIFLTASPEARAKRRYDELMEKGVETTFEDVYNDMVFRDKNDSGREFAPLKPAEDSVMVDTTDLTLEQSIDRILCLSKDMMDKTI